MQRIQRRITGCDKVPARADDEIRNPQLASVQYKTGLYNPVLSYHHFLDLKIYFIHPAYTQEKKITTSM